MTSRAEAQTEQAWQRGALEDFSMDTETLTEKSYLELLYSEDNDASFPVKLTADVAETSPDQSAEPVCEDQENNLDVFFTVEKNESGEEILLCSNPGEAYEKIATLADYLLKGPEEKPVEEVFENLDSEEEVAVKDLGGSKEAKRHSSCSNAPEPKRRKAAGASSLCIFNGDSFIIPLDDAAASVAFCPNFHVQFCVATISPAGKPSKAFGSSASLHLGDHPLSAKEVHVIVEFPPFTASGAASIGTHPDKDMVDKGHESPPVPPEPVHKCPEFVEAFCTSLKNHFRDVCKFAPMEQEIPLDKLYTEARMVRCPAESKTGKNADMSLCNPDERGKAIVQGSQLFQVPGKSDLETKIIAVFGKAGLGKSLLVQKLCLDWANGERPEFDFIFRFDCRKLSLLLENRYSLRQLLLGLSDGPGEGGNDVCRNLLANPRKVLLVFDGLEELNDHDGLTAAVESPPLMEGFSIRSFLTALFQRKVLRGCTLLLTARPNTRWPQYFSRMDTVLEAKGFSGHQAQTYLTHYLKASGCSTEAQDLIRSAPYLLSHCYNPALCQLISKAALETGGAELPSTLTRLVVRMLLQRLAGPAEKGPLPRHQGVSALAQVAWTLMQRHQNAFRGDRFASAEVKEFALRHRLVLPFALRKNSGQGEEEQAYAFPSFVVQNFFAASHLVLAQEFRDKKLTQYLRLLSRTKKFLPSWDLVPHFLSGLLFLEDELKASLFFGQEGELDSERMVSKKQKSLSKYIRKLRIRNLGLDRLLQLLHCVHETEEEYLLQHVALELQPDLSFLGVPLTPDHVYVLCAALQRSPKMFTLDLEGSSVDTEGLRQLVTLRNVTSFRASLSEVLQLWRRLWEAREEEQLCCAIEKFSLLPFRAKTMKDVDALSALVNLQDEMAQSKADASDWRSRPIPAIAKLRQLEFMLGPTLGLRGFQKLVKILDVFPALQDLDLDSPDENEIGDEGASSLSEVLPRLTSLQALNLSRNKITDMGAEKLAATLPTLLSLRTLSLYNNSIGDSGAEHFAKILPRMKSLRVMDIHCNKITAFGAQKLTGSLQQCPHVQSMALWNPAIPHSILDYLQQQDSRIRLL